VVGQLHQLVDLDGRGGDGRHALMPGRRAPAGSPPDTLTFADRRLGAELALEDHGIGVLARAILEQPTRQAAIAYVRALLGKGVISGWTCTGDARRRLR
jgi:hypothetical protein